MQFSDINNQKIVADVTQKLNAYQSLIGIVVIVIAFGAYGYFFSQHYFELSKPATGKTVPMSADMQQLQSQLNLSFDGAESLRKNISSLKDFSEPVVGSVRGRTNPFDSYASPRPTH
jgi:hypothetical protein